MIRSIAIIILLLVSSMAIAQKTDIEYLTALDSTDVKHYLTFNKNGTVTIHYPIGRGVYWDEIINKPRTFSYLMQNDTVEIDMIGNTSTASINSIEKRILNSKFVLTTKGQLYDAKSGYIYIDKRRANKFRYGVVSFDNEIYVVKKKGNRAFKKLMRRHNIEDYKTKIITGKNAVDEFGEMGINGVIVIEKK